MDIQIYTLQEVCEKLKMPISTLRRYLREGKISGMKIGRNVHLEFEVAGQFLRNVNEIIQPFLINFCVNAPLFRIQVSCAKPTHSFPKIRMTGSATGLSCGLDSLATIKDLLKLEHDDPDRVKLAALFEVGGNDSMHTGNFEQLYSIRKSHAAKCADHIGLDFISIRSNVDRWFPGPFTQLHTLRNISAAYLLSGMIGSYYYANGVPITETVTRHSDSAYADAIILPLLSTEHIQFRQATPTLTAADKAKVIADFTAAHKFLNVCYFEGQNCGECEKCLRRMLLLDSLGLLERFAGVFPLHKWESNKNWYLGFILAHKRHSPPHVELIKHLWESRWRNRNWFWPRMAWIMRRNVNFLMKISGKPRRPL